MVFAKFAERRDHCAIPQNRTFSRYRLIWPPFADANSELADANSEFAEANSEFADANSEFADANSEFAGANSEFADASPCKSGIF